MTNELIAKARLAIENAKKRKHPWVTLQEVTDALEASWGYEQRPVQSARTAEDLDSLHIGAVVLSTQGLAYQAINLHDGFLQWQAVGEEIIVRSSVGLRRANRGLPFTVVYGGKVE